MVEPCRYALAKEVHQKLIEKLKAAMSAELTAEEQAAEMERMLAEEEKRQKEIDAEVKHLHDMKFRKTQELHEAEISERNIDAEILVRYDEICGKTREKSRDFRCQPIRSIGIQLTTRP